MSLVRPIFRSSVEVYGRALEALYSTGTALSLRQQVPYWADSMRGGSIGCVSRTPVTRNSWLICSSDLTEPGVPLYYRLISECWENFGDNGSVEHPKLFFFRIRILPWPSFRIRIRIRIRVVYEKYIRNSEDLSIAKKPDCLEKFIWTADHLNIAKKLQLCIC